MSWMKTPVGLDKLRVELPNHPHVTGETLWAKHLGDDLYELRNIPFHAYGLSFRDVVVASAPAPGEAPIIRRLHRVGGHRTVRVCFTEEALMEERIPSLMTLRGFGATFEGASQSYFAIDVESDGDYEAVCHQLRRWEEQGLLSVETCEVREVGSFDALPARPEPSKSGNKPGGSDNSGQSG
jgi:hypothetical protein